MIRNNIIQFPVYHTVTYILSAFSVQKYIILSAFSNKTGCKVTEILLMMQIKLHKIGLHSPAFTLYTIHLQLAAPIANCPSPIA
jgi:hypothetical protein